MTILQKADSIYIEEIRNAGLYEQISQAFAVLLPVKAVGVMGDKRTYEQVKRFIGFIWILLKDFLDLLARMYMKIFCAWRRLSRSVQSSRKIS